MEYASHGTFIDYIIGYSGFGEELTKIIFEKILKIIQFCHSKGYCHLDIKPENILLKEDYTLVLSDFGFANINKPNLEIYKGTPGYRSPQITGYTPYDGFKEDIFSFGVTLLYIAYKVKGFIEVEPEDKMFKIIIDENIEYFWENVKSFLDESNEEISQDLKDLYLQMISINPKDRPEKIDDILKDKWFYSIKNMSEEKKNDLIKAEFLKREKKVNEYTRKDLKKEALKSDLAHYKKSISDIETIIFTDDFEPKLIKSNIRFNDYITINVSVNQSLLMNELYYSLKNKLGEFILMEPSIQNLNFRFILIKI